jgi:hypothetical protein
VYGFNPWAGDWKATGDSRASAQGNGDHRSGSGGTGIYIRCAAFLLGCIRAWQRTVLSVPLSEPGVYPLSDVAAGAYGWQCLACRLRGVQPGQKHARRRRQ